MKFFDKHRIQTDMQHGFRAKQSTVTQLIFKINEFLYDGTSFHAVILDFEKAFDNVLGKLLRKLPSFGIQDSLLI